MNPRKRRLSDAAYFAASTTAGSAAGWAMSATGVDPGGSASFGLAVTAFLLAHNPVKQPRDTPDADDGAAHARVRIVRRARRRNSPRGVRRAVRRTRTSPRKKGRSRGSL